MINTETQHFVDILVNQLSHLQPSGKHTKLHAGCGSLVLRLIRKKQQPKN